ncbi:hypothetical protein [Clostridium drakei]|nr:hypothetical protein [Clostridium drakei]
MVNINEDEKIYNTFTKLDADNSKMDKILELMKRIENEKVQ